MSSVVAADDSVIDLFRSVAHFGAQTFYDNVPRAALRLPVASVLGPFGTMGLAHWLS
jgi:hypothetical protein